MHRGRTQQPMSYVSAGVSCVPDGEKKRPVGRSGFFFLFPNFIFHKLECTGEKRKKKQKTLKDEKQSSTRRF